MENNIIGNNIIKHRKKSGLSQTDLAKKTNLSQRSIAYYEREANNEIFEKLDTIAKALNITLADLFKDENSFNSNSLIEIDTRIIKRILEIKKLSVKDQNAIWEYIDFIIEKDKTKKQKQLQEIK